MRASHSGFDKAFIREYLGGPSGGKADNAGAFVRMSSGSVEFCHFLGVFDVERSPHDFCVDAAAGDCPEFINEFLMQLSDEHGRFMTNPLRIGEVVPLSPDKIADQHRAAGISAAVSVGFLCHAPGKPRR